ncbi:HEAT repeat protein [Leptospira yanagawae serovar Saopaulo str. Sao Paulo = ATCC 700523]|uniref:HEAT repeat protein n=1 Tax=Leptospira yanagawae serovar Saopaulo str. Sao Paulo = ATCC 700523 TaxID=1249483 RepID=A0A5E8H9P6_9LEPT|nr:HEAT repeat domain-containing protein [Leptospira yanagawae]EOQ87523.1 HEAT repeat protein [Leptospira yanagawae serovar Saopaulo str. Sao Paulo = ATCC 700523]
MYLIQKFIIIILLFTLIQNCFGGPNEPETKEVLPMEEELSNDVLLQTLESGSNFDKGQAAIQLGNRGVSKAVPLLRQLLSDKDPGLRAGAAIALGDLKDKISSSKIANLMWSDTENPKDVYLDALTRMKDPSVSNRIYPLLDSENPTIRLQTVDTLVQIGANSVGSQILAMATKNKDREKDKTFAMVIGKLKISSGENYLLNLTKVQDDSPTLAASYLALGRIKAKHANEVLIQALTLPFDKGKENASLALIEIGNPTVIPKVFSVLKGENIESKLYATDVLCSIPSKEAGKLAFGILNSNETMNWGYAAKIIGKQKYKEGKNRLEELLLKPNTPDRDHFAEALGWIGDPSSVPILRKVLLSGEKEGPYGSAWALGVMGAKESVPDLILALEKGDAKLMVYVLEALGSIADPSSLPKLKLLLSDRPKMAPQILSTVALIKTEEARLVLEDATRSKNAEVYRPAMEEVAKRKDKKSIPLLLELANGEDAEKRKLSYYALTSITGQKFRSAKEWNLWVKDNP